MNRFLALIIAIHACYVANGQFRDSLFQVIANAKEDTNKVNAFNELSFTYAWSDADTSIMNAQRGMDLAQKLKFDVGVAKRVRTERTHRSQCASSGIPSSRLLRT